MTKVLDIVDASLQEIEEQLLDEFKRIRNTLSDSPFESIDKGIQNSLTSVVQDLLHRLENSGDKTNLQLQTERHETLFARTSVIKQLLKAKIPTAYLHEVHQDVSSSRKKLENQVVAKREQDKTEQENTTQKNTDKNRGLLGSIKNIFSSNKSKQEVLGNRIRITDQEAKEFEAVEIYLDNGIYSASRELAMLSSKLVEKGTFSDPTSEPTDVPTDKVKKEARHPSPTGKATFESKDLSQQAPPLQTGSIAQTPDEIRRKLENNQTKSKTASTFESKELSQTISPLDNIQTTTKADLGKIALSPEEIRKKLASRQDSGIKGKATFGSKDVESSMPEKQKAEQNPPQTIDKDPPSPKGKAIFESKDLSQSGPTRKR